MDLEGGDAEQQIDWVAVERSDAFRALQAARTRFVAITLGIFAVAVGGFLVCCGYARDFMGSSISGSLTVAYVWLLSLTLLAFAEAYAYLRFSTRTLAPAAERIARDAGLPPSAGAA